MDYEGTHGAEGEFGSSNLVPDNANAAVAAAAGSAGEIVLLPDAANAVVLPQGASLDDIHVRGRDLVIDLGDGRIYVIPDGAVHVPEIVIDDVAVPPLNLAALLIGQEPAPAAGAVQSSGGNFADPLLSLQDPYGLGDLLPYTELAFPENVERDHGPAFEEREPDVVIENSAPATDDASGSVREAGLPAARAGGIKSPGSLAGSGSNVTTGTIIISAPDGLGAVSINGVQVTGVAGQQIVTDKGVLVLGALSGNQITYVYTLQDNTSGDATNDVFVVTITDSDGDSATANLTIQIIDDAPTARNDTDLVPAGSFISEAGNVVTGAGTTSGATGADTLGADGAPVAGSVTGIRAGENGTFLQPGSTVQGQFGVLTIHADGSYTYVRNPRTPGGVTDTFTYELTDGDGDTSTAKLTITIGDSLVGVTVPTTREGTTVSEAGLPARGNEPAGSQSEGSSEIATGTINIVAPDGIADVKLNGVTITEVGQQITLPSGVLTVVGFDPDTGTLTYVFVLTDNTSGDNVKEAMIITVTDLDGDTTNEPFIVTIIDDVPTARDDSADETTENAPVTVNVFANDTQGADGVNLATGVKLVPGSLTGGGALVNNGDGTFTYTPASGDGDSVTFQYTITDGDGDTSTAMVTIALQPDSTPSLEVSGERSVDEAGLPARDEEPAGSDSASNSEVTSGTISISTGGDTIGSVVIGGVDVTNGGTVTGASGTLVVTREGSTYNYTYRLTDNTSGDATTDSFHVVVTDSDGSVADDDLVIAIVDDVPTAVRDVNAIAAGQYGPATGNVVTGAGGDGGKDVQGADGVTVTAISGATAGTVGGTTAGLYGTLTLNADGSYSYVRNPGTPGGVSDTFNYTITDSDGDESSTTLTIKIADSKTTLDLPGEGEAGTRVEEAGLPSGSAAASDSEKASGEFEFTAPDGPATVKIDDVTVTDVGQTFIGNYGTLVIDSIADGKITYTYTLTTNTSGNATFDDFLVTVTDVDGDSTAGTLTVQIVDDVPTARNDADSVTEDSALIADGNVITGTGGSDTNDTDGNSDTRGADGANVSAVSFGDSAGTVGGSTAGDYGALVLNADGSYTYTLNNGLPAVQGLDSNDTLTDVFSYTLRDADGDFSTATLTITVKGADDQITINGLSAEGAELTVYENDLSDGSSPNAAALTQTGTFTVNGLDGISSIRIQGTEASVGQTFTTAHGVFTITGLSAPADGNATAITVAYSYKLTDNTTAHTGDDNGFLTESFAVAVTDTDGSTAADTVEVRIVDDAPLAANDVDAVTEDGALVADGNVITGSGGSDINGTDGNPDTRGADGASISAVNFGESAGTVGGSTDGAYGTLVLNSDGSYTYTLSNGLPEVQALGNNDTLTEVFSYTLLDGDGDVSTATLTISIKGTDDQITITGLNANGPDVTVYEDDLTDGSSPNAAALTQPGTFTVNGQDGIASIRIQGVEASVGQTFTTAHGVFTITGLSAPADGNATAITVTYSYKLTDNTTGHTGANNASLTESFAVAVTDTDGSTAADTVEVRIVDDAPLAANDVDSVTEDSALVADGNVITGTGGSDTNTTDGNTDTRGADGANVSAVSFGASAGTVGGWTAGAYGTLVLNANGSYTYTLGNGSAAVQGLDSNDTLTEVFSYTLRDGDGDTSIATLTITIKGADDQITINGLSAQGPDLTVYEDDLADGSSPNAAALTQTGTFTVNGVDGIASIRIEGTEAFVGQSFTTAHGVFTITGLSAPVDGNATAITVSYSYKLTDNTTAHTGGNNASLTESFAVAVTDTDGSTAADTVEVRIVDDVPSIDISAVTAGLIVDESLGTTGSVQNEGGAVNSDETALGAEAGAIGFAKGTLFTTTSVNAGADGEASRVYGLSVNNTNSGLVDAVTNQNIVLSLTAGGVIEGRTETGNALVFKLSVNTATGEVTLNQFRAIEHNDSTNHDENSGSEATSLAGRIGLGVTLTDGDGDKATDTVDISTLIKFEDDGPSAGADSGTTTEVPLGQPLAEITGNLTANDDFGTDGGRLQSITVGAVTYTWNGSNSITVSSGGSIAESSLSVTTALGGKLILDFSTGDWSYKAPPSVVSTTNEVFNYTIVDGDGDTSTSNLKVTILNDSEPTTTAVSAAVDDDALSGGNAGGTGDLATNLGVNGVAGGGDDDLDGAASSEATFSGVLGINYGTDGAGVVTFAQLHGQTVAVGTETATLSWNAATHTLTATGPRGVLFSVELTNTSTGAYKVTLLDNVLHATGANENDATVALTYRVADGNGTTTTGVLNITFDDDSPAITNTSNVNLTGATLSAVGNFAYAIGADSRSAFSVANGDFTSIALAGTVGSGAISNVTTTKTAETATSATFTFGFTYDSDPNLAGIQAANATGSMVFNKSTGQYTFTLDQPIATFDSASTSSMISSESYNLAGSAQSQPEIVVSKLDTNLFIRFTGIDGGLNAGSDTSFSNGETISGNQSWVSITGSENGVGSDTLQSSEVLNADFYTASPGGSTSPTAPTARADTVYLKLDQLGNNENMVIVLKLVDPDDGTTTTRTVIVDSADIWKPSDGTNPYNLSYDGANPGVIIIESNDYNFGSENYQIAGMQVMVSTSGLSLGSNAINLNRAVGASGASTFNDDFTGTDDNDVIKVVEIGIIQKVVSTQELKLNIGVTVTDADGDATTATVKVNGGVPPVVIDLDGDGVEFLSHEAGVTFDYAGDGTKVLTAWAGNDDGLLAIDLNGDGKVNDGSEIVFGGNGLTDLQGLAAKYDSNGDGVLDANDASFAKFGVWQDANSNGASDEGEFHSLTEAGITSINLVSDGVTQSAANGDVTVHGTSTYTADGTTGTLADASFSTAELDRMAARTAEMTATTAAAAATLLATAAVAATADVPPALPAADVDGASHDTAAAPADVQVEQPASVEPEQASQLLGTPSHEDKPADEGSTHEDAGNHDHVSALTAPVDYDAASQYDTVAAHDDAGSSALQTPAPDFASHGGGAALMDALLAAAAKAPAANEEAPAESVGGTPVLHEVVADAAAESFVDKLLDQFAGANDDKPHTTGEHQQDGLLVALDGQVSGGGAMPGGFDASHIMDHAIDHANAAAAAAAA